MKKIFMATLLVLTMIGCQNPMPNDLQQDQNLKTPKQMVSYFETNYNIPISTEWKKFKSYKDQRECILKEFELKSGRSTK